jgi:hypothetical protein
MKNVKTYKSETYNYIFNKDNGFFARWGKSMDDDPVMSPIGPEIADIEVSTICTGPFGKRCAMCYKNGTAHNENMTIDTFIRLLEKLNQTKNLTQIAFGIGEIGRAHV